MSQAARDDRDQVRPAYGPAAQVLERLFAEKGLQPGQWWPFLVQGEGKPLPGGLESLSGFVLTRDGDVYGWWLDWQDLGDAPAGETGRD
ncbi:MAG: hypothetical protein ACRDI2_24150, partial [Chloroflexota bacterium]